MTSSKGRYPRTTAAMLAGTAAAEKVIGEERAEAERRVVVPPGYEKLTAQQLALDQRSFEFGRLAGMAFAVEKMREFQFVPGKGRSGTTPTADIDQETAAYVDTLRASALIGRSPSSMMKWSMAGGSPDMVVIPYSDPSNARLLLWKVSELRAFLARYRVAAVREIEPRAAYRERRKARQDAGQGGTAAGKLGLR